MENRRCRARVRAIAAWLVSALVVPLACDRGDVVRPRRDALEGWEIRFEVRLPSGSTRPASIQAVGRESLGTGRCARREPDGDVYRCSWLIHGTWDALRYVTVERGSDGTEVYVLGLGFGEGAGGWSSWRAADYVASSSGVHFALLRDHEPIRAPGGLPEDATRLRFRGEPWPPVPTGEDPAQ